MSAVKQITKTKTNIHVLIIKDSGEHHRLTIPANADLNLALSDVNLDLRAQQCEPVSSIEWSKVSQAKAIIQEPT